MIRNQQGSTVMTDEEGYLVDPASWDEQVAQQLSREEQLSLSTEHWQIIDFMRRYYESHQVAPDTRFTVRFMAQTLEYGKQARNRLFRLFPYGYVKQACKIAGMKRPRGWSTG